MTPTVPYTLLVVRIAQVWQNANFKLQYTNRVKILVVLSVFFHSVIVCPIMMPSILLGDTESAVNMAVDL